MSIDVYNNGVRYITAQGTKFVPTPRPPVTRLPVAQHA